VKTYLKTKHLGEGHVYNFQKLDVGDWFRSTCSDFLWVKTSSDGAFCIGQPGRGSPSGSGCTWQAMTRVRFVSNVIIDFVGE
jgi:hypothetical protein